jgi:hypothetical protein
MLLSVVDCAAPRVVTSAMISATRDVVCFRVLSRAYL